ncbi:MAG: hypothetical protein U0514_01935 [Candidatus Andersenbacteria bacterium]
MIIKESLSDQTVLAQFKITHEEVENIDNAAVGQPSRWHLLSVTVDEDKVQEAAGAVSRALKKGKWYVDFSSDSEKIVVYPGRVFRYQRGNAASRVQAVTYGRSLGIPESQLDWKE